MVTTTDPWRRHYEARRINDMARNKALLFIQGVIYRRGDPEDQIAQIKALLKEYSESKVEYWQL